MRSDISQVPILNNKEADVAYLRCIETNPMCREYWVSDSTLETEWAPSLSAITSGSSGRIGMSRPGSGYNSGLFWSSGYSLTPIFASSLGTSRSSINSLLSNHRSGSMSLGFWQIMSSP